MTRDQKSALKQAEFYSEHLHLSKQDIYHQLISEYGQISKKMMRNTQ